MADPRVLVVGIDPGSRRTGYGVVAIDGRTVVHVSSGTLAIGDDSPLAERLARLHAGLSAVLSQHRPAEAAVEAIFYAKSARAAMVLGHARGVALLSCAQAGLTVAEYAPARVKSAVTGYGQAEKRQVALSIRLLLGMTTTPAADAADALAIAWTHAIGRRSAQRRATAVVQRVEIGRRRAR